MTEQPPPDQVPTAGAEPDVALAQTAPTLSFSDRAVDAERSADPILVYARSCEAMRDTTKWILSFVPGAALIVTLAGVVPDLAALKPSDRDAPTGWLVAAAGLIGIATALAVWVLAASPPRWDWIYDRYGAETKPGATRGSRSFSNELDRSGILHLFGYRDGRQFFEAINEKQTDHIKSAPGAGGTILDFASLRELRRRFVIFVAAGSVAAVGAVACIAVARGVVADKARASAAAALEKPPKIGAPLAAQVFPTKAGLDRLRAAGCSAADPDAGVSVWVVAGDLADGTVIVSEEGCTPRTLRHWLAATDGVVVPAGG